MKIRNLFKYIAKPFNIFILLCIIIFVLIFAQAMTSLILYSFYRTAPQPEPNGLKWDIAKAGKCFMPDGRVLLTDHENKLEKIYDANYTKLWEGAGKDRPEEYGYLVWATSLQSNVNKSSFTFNQRITPDMTRYLEIPIRQNKKIKEIWRYLYDKDVFEGFNFKGGKIGYFGANGFCESITDCQPFGEFSQLSLYVSKESENPVLIWQTKNRLYAIDIENHQTELLIDSNEEISRVEYKNWKYQKSTFDPNYRSTICYYTKEGNIHLILNEPQEKLTITLPKQWENYYDNSIKVTTTKDSIYLHHRTTDIFRPVNEQKTWKDFINCGRGLNEKDVNSTAELYKVDKTGNLNFVNNFKWIKPARKPGKDWLYYYYSHVSFLSPPVFAVITKTILNLPKDFYISLMRKDSMARIYIELISGFSPKHVKVNIALSFIMIAITLWHGWARKNNRFVLTLWAVLVGLFGLAGLLTYLALNHKTTIKCTACDKKRNLEKDECIRCGTLLPKTKREVIIAD